MLCVSEYSNSHHNNWRSDYRGNYNFERRQFPKQKVGSKYGGWRISDANRNPEYIVVVEEPYIEPQRERAKQHVWVPTMDDNDKIETASRYQQWNRHLWALWQYQEHKSNGCCDQWREEGNQYRNTQPYYAYHGTKSLMDQYYARFGTDEAFLFESDF